MAFLGIYRAVYDYAPQSEEELEIKDGDLLFVLEKSTDDDWWKAKKKAASDDDDEPEGLIPNNYVEEAKPIHKARAMYDYTKQTDEELNFKEDTRVDVYDTSDPDWTLIGFNGEYGFAPAIYIEELSASKSASPAETELAPPPMPARPTTSQDEDAIPGEAGYVAPGQRSGPNPAAALAGIIAQRTGGGDSTPPVSNAAPQRALASPPMPSRPRYPPEESEEDEPAPSLPQRPMSQASPPPAPRPEPIAVSPTSRTNGRKQQPEEPFSPGHFRLYNIYEMVSHMGKNKKMPTTLGINIAKGVISISPEQRSDGPSFEWTAEKLTHYSIEGKHVFMELIRPSKSVDFHAGAKDTAKEIVALLGELAGAVRQEGLREVLAASAGTSAGGVKTGHMLYEHMALGDDEVTVAAGDEVVVLDDISSEDWWKIRRLRNGKEGVVPSSYVEVTGKAERGPESITGLNAARSTVEQNRLEEERLARESAKRSRKTESDNIPERASSLATEPKKSSQKESRSKDLPKSKPNMSQIRTWTDRSGTFKVDAQFIGLRENKIHLHKLNGVKIAVPVAKMAVEDLEYVERATGTSLDDDKPLSDIKRRSTQKVKDKETRNGATVEKKDEYDWFEFFLSCGVNPQICERYASAFSKDQMGVEVLPDVNASLLRTLGLKEGDILRVMKILDAKYNRTTDGATTDGANGSLFTDASGALRNNTRKGRPAPPVQTNDVIDESAFKTKAAGNGNADSVPTSASRSPSNQTGFDDDAWNVQPARSQPSVTPVAARAPVPEPPKPKVNDDIALLSLSSPPLQPTAAPTPAPAPAPAPAPVPVPASAPAQAPAQTASYQTPQGADQAIFDKIAALAPQQTAAPRQRPAPPQQQLMPGNLAPPPRAASAPGFPPQQGFGVAAPLQPNYTGFQSQAQLAPPGQSLQDLQTLQRLQQAGLIPQMTNMPPQQTGYGGYPQQMNGGFISHPTGIPAMQQNYPALQPQPTSFVPQSQFGQAAYGGGLTNTQQTYANGGFMSQPTGFAGQQTGFSNGFGAQPTQGQAPQLPPQQTGGVFGPSQPITPLVPQKTGPPPPVRFGVQGGTKPLVPQRTGRAELSRATPQNPFGF